MTSKPDVHRNKAGFTLLEVVISMSILSISLVTLLSAHNRAIAMNDNAVKLTEAVTLGREEMERIYMGALPQPDVSEIQTREDYPGLQWTTNVKKTPFEGAYEVDVKVARKGKDMKHEIYTLKAYVNK